MNDDRIARADIQHTSPDIQLHIEELVLHGFDGVDGQALRAALGQELTRLFTERGVPEALARGYAAPALDGGAIPPAPSHAPHDSQRLARHIAHNVYSSLQTPRRSRDS